MESDRPQHNHAETCVIAQQYSSPTLTFSFTKEKFSARFTSVAISITQIILIARVRHWVSLYIA
jgi:hypothetical protein